MQSINFGRIEGLAIRAGQPSFDPPPAVIREIKIGGENGPRRELDNENFLLRDQVIELFDHFERLANAQVRCLEVKHGLPFRLTVAGSS